MEAARADGSYHVLLNVIAGITQRRVVNKVNGTDCAHLRQILLGMPRYGNRRLTKEHLAYLLGMTGRHALDDLFRSVGEDPVVLPTGKRSAGIALGTEQVSALRELVASRDRLPTYQPDIFEAATPAESPLEVAQRRIAELQNENERLREQAQEVASGCSIHRRCATLVCFVWPAHR